MDPLLGRFGLFMIMLDNTVTVMPPVTAAAIGSVPAHGAEAGP